VISNRNVDEFELATSLSQRLFPLLRSLTGDGVRVSHDIIGEILPLERVEVPSGTPVFDWNVPQEWRVNDAYIIGPDGEQRFNVRYNSLRLVSYSVPFKGKLTLRQLDEHLHSLPDLPNAIPYVTSYYKPRWGFCLTEDERSSLPDGDYQVVVDTELFDGSMTMSEAVLHGSSGKEVLFSAYTCHPRLANDELTGAIALPLLYRRLAKQSDRRLTYRFLFAPETIGSLAYLAQNGEALRQNLIAGCVVNNLARSEPYRFKRSQRGDTLIDRAFAHVLREHANILTDFEPIGSDERQFCSPGFDLPVGNFARSEAYFPEYHTSLDNLENMSIGSVIEAVDRLEEVCAILEGNKIFRNCSPFGEPQLSRRNAYPDLGSTSKPEENLLATMWTLNQSNGSRDLLSIAERSKISFDIIAERAAVLEKARLLEEIVIT
jgi:aminopeptidase-like protein